MKNKVWKIAVVVATFVILVGVLYVWIGKNSENSENNNFFNLKPPSFIGMAGATGTGGGSYFPENEAGMSAYLHPVSSINLEDVKPVFTTIDVEESEYIIGTISVNGAPESEYPYVYVDTSGWIVAYYPKETRPYPSYIIPFGYWGSQTTNPTEAIKKVCNQISAPFAYENVGYYDFRYPSATGMVIALEDRTNTGCDYFYITIPESHTVYNVSWAFDSRSGDSAELDGLTFVLGGGHKFGYFSDAKFSKGIQHTIGVHRYGSGTARLGIVIIYSQ